MATDETVVARQIAASSTDLKPQLVQMPDVDRGNGIGDIVNGGHRREPEFAVSRTGQATHDQRLS